VADYDRSPEQLRMELGRLESAVSGEIEWLKNWHLNVLGAAVSGSDLDLTSIEEKSPFRVWYDGAPRDIFGDSSAFVALGLSLETVQTLARSVAQTVKYTGKFPPDEYKAFMDAVGLFNELVFKLQRESLFQVAHIDDLTGAGDEVAMRDEIIAERERVKRMDQEACIAVAEIGSFTAEDGLEEHVSRSEVLLEFAVTLAEQLRPYDRLYRIDNDRFLVCLPYTDVDVAKIVMDRLHGKITGGSLALEDGTRITLEAHIGIAPVGGDEDVDTILAHAEEALETARSNALTNVFMWERKDRF